MLTLFVFDTLFAAYLLILAGGLGTTYCLYKLAIGTTFSMSDKKRLGLVEFSILEEKRQREKAMEELRREMIENYKEILKNQNDISEIKKKQNEKT